MSHHHLLILASAALVTTASAAPVSLSSPDGNHILRISDENGAIHYSIESAGKPVITPTPLAITIGGTAYPENVAITESERKEIRNDVKPVISTIATILNDSYNEAVICFDGPIKLRCRAYDDGVAFRWETSLPDQQITVDSESLAFHFAEDFPIYFPQALGEEFFTHQENLYHLKPISETAGMKVASAPLLVDRGTGNYLLISDVNVHGYPGLWVNGTDNTTLSAVFPPYPLETKLDGDRSDRVSKPAPFIARTTGKRDFPWRAFVLTDAKGLLTSSILWNLAEPSRIKDPSWIKPGKVAWDWWNYNNIYDVPFRAGVNQETYKHFIDFAAEMELPYIVLDEGWSQRGADNLLKVVPEIQMQELADYGRSKGVRLILWMTSIALERNFDAAFEQFSAWGVAGLKIDFMQRDDQVMMDFLYRTAEVAAQREILLNFHGGSKPAGLLRTWPNVLTHESVPGLEQCKWGEDASPGMAVLLPFIRMVVGPMDYTPGAMVNLQKSDFKPMFNTPASQGTRCHQLAMYVVFLSPLQMLADTPTNYRRNPDCLPFIKQVPTTWDETKVLHAEVGKSLTVARRHGKNWFIGGLTDWNPREESIDLGFLGEGIYHMSAWMDGINADRNGNDFRIEKRVVTAKDTLQIKLAPGGGCAVMFEPAGR
jgi:alpha-glucosidase